MCASYIHIYIYIDVRDISRYNIQSFFQLSIHSFLIQAFTYKHTYTHRYTSVFADIDTYSFNFDSPCVKGPTRGSLQRSLSER